MNKTFTYSSLVRVVLVGGETMSLEVVEGGHEGAAVAAVVALGRVERAVDELLGAQHLSVLPMVQRVVALEAAGDGEIDARTAGTLQN